MVTDAVGHGLQVHGRLVLDDVVPGQLCGLVDGDGVVAVDSDGLHAVGRPADGRAVGVELFLWR